MSVAYLSVSWQTYHTLALQLAYAIRKKEKSLDSIVAIGRGGLTIGHLLADLLQIPICSITIQSYTDIQNQGKPVITAGLAKQITYKHILLVDDIADSGTTLTRATAYLRTFGPSRITVATLFYKPHSSFLPDYYALKTTKWILQPFEITEWILTFTKNMTQEGKSKTDIHAFLRHLGYTRDQIKFAQQYFSG